MFDTIGNNLKIIYCNCQYALQFVSSYLCYFYCIFHVTCLRIFVLTYRYAAGIFHLLPPSAVISQILSLLCALELSIITTRFRPITPPSGQVTMTDSAGPTILLTHWGRDKMAAIFRTTFSNAFSWMKIYEFRLRFHWNLFLRVQLTIFQHWFR